VPLPGCSPHLGTPALLAISLAFALATNAAVTGMRSPDFEAPRITANPFWFGAGVSPLPDGRVVVGGGFALVNGSNRPALAALHADGRFDNSFRPPLAWDADHSLRKTVIQPAANQLSSPKLLVSGFFTGTNYALLPQLFRLHSDGALDASFQFDMRGHGGYMSDFAVADDGAILATGTFYISGNTERSLARFDRDGSLDTNFLSDYAGFIGHRILLQNDGRYLVGATLVATNPVSYAMVRFNADGSRDDSFNLPADLPFRGLPGWFSDSQNRLYLHGYDGTNSLLLRLNSNGDPDEGFSIGLDLEFPSYVSDLIEWNGMLYVAGEFRDPITLFRRSLVRVFSDGTVDLSFAPGHEDGFQGLAAQGNVLYGFGYHTSNGVSVVAFDTNGIVQYVSDARFEQRGEIYALARQSSGKLLLAGTVADDTIQGQMVRLGVDGRLDPTFRFTNWATQPFVLGNDAFLAPTFVANDGLILTPRLQRYDSNGGWDATYEGPTSGWVENFSVDANSGKVVLTTHLDGPTFSLPIVQRLQADGTPDPTFAVVNVTSYWVKALLALKNGKTLAAGSFMTASGTASLLRLDENGAVDLSFWPNSQSVDWMVEGLAQETIIYGFDSLSGTHRLLRLLENGVVDSSFNPAFGSNSTLVCAVVQPDGKTIVWGRLLDANNRRLPPVVRLDASGVLDRSFQCDDSVEGYAKVLVLEPSGDIIVGGIFSVAPESSEAALLRLTRYPEPVFGSVRFDAGKVALDLQTVRGRTYRVETSIDFSQWEPVAEVRATNTYTTVRHAATHTAQFYRARLAE
jgi:uncharacterized delta-60 repeat protein